MEDRQAAYLLDILNSADAITHYLRECDREGFLQDAKTQDAVLRRLMVIGEAAARLTEETCSRFTQLPFRKMAGLRNRVVHDYGRIDLEIVWDTVTSHLPLLRETLREFFEEVPTDLRDSESLS
jgi:uncharacterized protein with HEPN domain